MTAAAPRAPRVYHGAWYLLGVALIFVLVVGLAALDWWLDRERDRERAAQATHNIARLLDQNISDAFDKTDVGLQAIAYYYTEQLRRGPLDAPQLNAHLAHQRSLHPEVQNLRILDRDGMVRFGFDAPTDAPTSMADRSFYQRARDEANAGLIVFGPVFTRLTKRWVLVLARRLERPDHGFDGVVYANIAVDSFDALVPALALGTHGAATVRMADLALVHRVPRSSVPVGSQQVSAELAHIAATHSESGSFVAATAIDGIERVNAYRRLRKYPVYVIVGLATRDFQGAGRAGTWMIGLLGLLAMGIASLGALLIYRSTRVLAADIEARKYTEAALTGTQAELVKAQRLAHLGNWSWDLLSQEQHWSEEIYRIYGRDIDGPPLSYAEVQQYCSASSWPDLRARVERCLADGSPFSCDTEVLRHDGSRRWIAIGGEALRNGSGHIVKLHGTVQDITARKQLEHQLAAANAELSNLYDSAPCGYFTLDAEGRFQSVNQTALSWLGRTRAELVGRLRPSTFLSAGSRPHFQEVFARLKAQGHVEEEEFQLRQASGQLRRVSITANVSRDAQDQILACHVAMFDITEIRRTQDQLQRVLSEQQQMLDSHMVGVFRSRDRRVVWANAAVRDLLGYTPEELVGQSTQIFFADKEAYARFGVTAYPQLARGQNFREQLQMRRKDGQMLWVDVQGVMLPGERLEILWMTVDISAIKHLQIQVEHQAFHDALTGLPNRVLFNDRLHQALAAAARANSTLAVCFLDLDHFKPVNDIHGHAAGDRVLREVARRLLASVRANDTVARLGGDEFTLVLASPEEPHDYRSVLQRVVESVGAPIDLGDGLEAHVSISIGVALYPDDGLQPELLLSRADGAMYQAKSVGGNGWHLHESLIETAPAPL